MAKSEVASNRAELKKWLNRAGDKPVHFAFAFGGDGKAIVALDGLKQARALEKSLKDTHPDSKNHRSGIVLVAPDAPDVAKFVVNKAIGGAARKLAVALKGTGYKKVELVLEDGSAIESAEGEDEENEAPDQPVAAPAPTDAGTAPPSDGNAEPETAEQPDAGALMASLAALIKRVLPIIQADPNRKDALRELAAAAQSSLKGGDPAAASASIDQLRGMLDDPEAMVAAANMPPAGGAKAGSAAASPPPVIAKARAAWVATRHKVDSDIQGLHGAFTKAFKGHAREGDLAKSFQARVDTVLDALDEGLAHTLDAVNGAADPAERAKLVEQAHATIESYKKHVASDPTIAELDRNPFIPLSIQKTMTATLTALSKSIR